MDEYEQVEQEANEEQIQSVEAGTGTTSLRISWGRRRGEFVGNLTNVPFVRPDWRVFAAAGEGIVDGDPTAGKFMGAAKFTVNNVVPENGNVRVWVTIAWDQPIVLFIDYLFIAPF
jgi:hypothetical protein